MKRLILTTFVAVAAISFASAQWTTSGGFETTTNKVRADVAGGANMILNHTSGKAVSLNAGTTGSTFRFDDSGTFKIQKQSKTDILAGLGASAVSVFNVEAAPANSFNLLASGFVGIGTQTPGSMLAVNGTILATEAKVKADVTTPDYVFESDYSLRSLNDVEVFVRTNKHLPDMPSAADLAQNGITLGQMSMDLLKKVEELTLYMIDLKKENEALKARIEDLEK
jgi:hypothetical protein